MKIYSNILYKALVLVEYFCFFSLNKQITGMKKAYMQSFKCNYQHEEMKNTVR